MKPARERSAAVNELPVFDFDGVICDASNETLLVTWLAEDHSAPRDVADATGGAIPSGFAQAFLHCRAYARHVGHLSVTFHPALLSVRTQREFDALYAGLEPADVEHFTRRFEVCRQRFRESACDRWFAAHRLYPGIAALLHGLAGDFYVVTAKDKDSVLAVLAHYCVSVDR